MRIENNNTKISDLIKQKNHINTFAFLNVWCSTKDGSIPNILPDKILKSTVIHNVCDRSKCIYKTNFHNYIDIHNPLNTENTFIHNSLKLLHFENWTSDRHFNEPFILTEF
jgi:hypothetical protein